MVWVKRAGAGIGVAARPGGIRHVDACANALWNSSTGFENYKECLEKVNLRLQLFVFTMGLLYRL